MKGKLIVIEGLDGAGKATQAAALAQRLAAAGKSALPLSFPNYGKPYAEPARLYLAGELGGDVGSYGASVLYAVDRFCSYKLEWGARYLAGELLLCDRYTTSNAVYQTARLPKEQWDEYLSWLYDLEYNKMGIPAPDLVVFLDVLPELASALMEKRYGGDEQKRDIHERDYALQQKSREAALHCAEHQGWRVVSCAKGGALRAVGDIAEEVYSLVEQALS